MKASHLLSLVVVCVFVSNEISGQIKVNHLQDIFFKDTSTFYRGFVNLKANEFASTTDYRTFGQSTELTPAYAANPFRSHFNLVTSNINTSTYNPNDLRTRKLNENNITAHPNFWLTGYSNELIQNQSGSTAPAGTFAGFLNRISKCYARVEGDKNDIQDGWTAYNQGLFSTGDNIFANEVSGLYNYITNNRTINTTQNIYGVQNLLLTKGSAGLTTQTKVYGEKTLFASQAASGTFTNDFNGEAYGLRVDIPSGIGTGYKCGVYSNVPIGTNQYSGVFTGDILYKGSLLVSSDKKVKTDIVDMENALDKVMKMQPKSYRLIYDQEKREHFGFIAQELETVFPTLVQEVQIPGEEVATTVIESEFIVTPKVDAQGNTTYVEEKRDKPTLVVTSEASENLLSVNYVELIPILIKSIQEQQEQIRILEARIKVLEDEK